MILEGELSSPPIYPGEIHRHVSRSRGGNLACVSAPCPKWLVFFFCKVTFNGAILLFLRRVHTFKEGLFLAFKPANFVTRLLGENSARASATSLGSDTFENQRSFLDTDFQIYGSAFFCHPDFCWHKKGGNNCLFLKSISVSKLGWLQKPISWTLFFCGEKAANVAFFATHTTPARGRAARTNVASLRFTRLRRVWSCERPI